MRFLSSPRSQGVALTLAGFPLLTGTEARHGH